MLELQGFLEVRVQTCSCNLYIAFLCGGRFLKGKKLTERRKIVLKITFVREILIKHFFIRASYEWPLQRISYFLLHASYQETLYQITALFSKSFQSLLTLYSLKLFYCCTHVCLLLQINKLHAFRTIVVCSPRFLWINSRSRYNINVLPSVNRYIVN